MPQAHDAKPMEKSEPLIVVRTFAAPRALVFKAWSSAEHIKRWFSPEGLTTPEAEVDFRAGGVFAVCMRTPEGQDHWSRGRFVEVAPPDRLAFSGAVVVDGEPKFTVHTVVTFEDDGAGTRMSVRQDYDIHDEAFRAAVKGAYEGWRTTLDKLEREVGRMQTEERAPAAHSSFSIERVFKATPAQLFRAFTDEAAKSRWFVGGAGYTILERVMDVRPGGRERAKGRWANGTVSTFDAVYFDVTPNERLVYAYEMHLDDRRISVSLATLEMNAVDAGTRLTLTEQGAFLNGYEDGGSRERGTNMLLDQVAASLTA
jgi:uncharacterized protein YndB with AHSA1/START domain